MDIIKNYNDIVVVDATLHEVGPVATQMLAFLGAKVIHINRTDDNAQQRYLDFTVRNSNKKCVTLNTKTTEGKEIMWRLIEKADMFVENFAPGAWDRMGFSYEEVKLRNPEIIYVSIKGFARGSRFEHCITYNPVACCSGGSTYLSGMEEGAPMECGINIGDAGSSIVSSVLMAGAILRKKMTGKGCYLEAPMQNMVMSQSRRAFAEYYAHDGKVRRAGNSYRGIKPSAPHNVYPAQGLDVTGNYVMISCSGEDDSPDFMNLCEAIGREDLLSDPKYATPALRYVNRHALDFEISKWTIQRGRKEIVRKLAVEHKVACGAVSSIAELLEDEFLTNGKNVLRWMEDKDIPKTGGAFTPTMPLHMSSGDISPVTCKINNAANGEIYGGWLGMSEEDLKALSEKDVI